MKRVVLIVMTAVLFMSCLTTMTNDEGFKYINTYTNDKPSIRVVGYKGTDKHLVIPETINGRPVTEIGRDYNSSSSLYAFENMGLEDVTIPTSVRVIGFGSFRGNNLTSVVIPSGVREIDYRAFENNKLTSVTIPSSVLSIGKNAFRGNNLSLPNVIIPEHLKPLMGEIFDPFPQLIVMNQLAVPIAHLYLSPAGENKWEDIIKEPIAPGNGYGTDWIYRIRYDIRAVDSNGSTYTILNQDFSVTDGSVGKMIPITASRKDN